MVNVAITLDVAYDDDTLEDALRRMLIPPEFDSIGAFLVDDVGSTGWPLVQFFGPLSAMVPFVRAYFATDDGEALDLVSSFEKSPCQR